MVSFTLWPLYPQGKSPWYPLGWRLDGRAGLGVITIIIVVVVVVVVVSSYHRFPPPWYFCS
jgi:hypothetical protein